MANRRREFLRMIGAGAAVLAVGHRDVLRAGTPATSSIQFWDMRTGPDGYDSAAQKLISKYNARNEKFRVTYELQEWESWPQIFSIAIASGMAPDISTGGAYQAVQYYDQGVILEIDDVIASLRKSGEDKDFLPGTLERLFYKGHTVALPWGLDVRAIFYRKDLFAKAGLKAPNSWEELRTTAKALTSDGQYGFVIAGNDITAMHSLFQLMINNGGGLFSDDGKIDVMNGRNVEALTFLSDLVKDGSINPGSAKYSLDEAHREFFEGRGAIMIDGSGVHKEFPEQRDKIDLLPPPTGPHGDRGTISWVNNIMLYKQSKNSDATKDFLKWWSENQKPMWTEGRCGELPVRKSIASDPYFQNDPITKRLLDEWVPIGKGSGNRMQAIFPALNQLEGYGPMMTLFQDLLHGKDVVTSMRVAEERLKLLLR